MATLILNAAYVALLGSSFTRTITRLRLLLVSGAIAFIIYGVAEGIPSMVAWNVVIGSMHLLRIVRDRSQQRSVVLTGHEHLVRG